MHCKEIYVLSLSNISEANSCYVSRHLIVLYITYYLVHYVYVKQMITCKKVTCIVEFNSCMSNILFDMFTWNVN